MISDRRRGIYNILIHQRHQQPEIEAWLGIFQEVMSTIDNLGGRKVGHHILSAARVLLIDPKLPDATGTLRGSDVDSF